MPVQKDSKQKKAEDEETIEEDALSILSLEYGDEEDGIAADAISLAWAGAGDGVSPDSIASIATRQRRGRRRALAARRRTAATKKRREAMVK